MSVGRTGQCWDDALAESFFVTISSLGYFGPPDYATAFAA